jgi:ParB family chromosome partitioning protein
VGSSGHLELDRATDSIRVGYRFRRDLGDLGPLCASIQALGLLQPVTITPDGTLVCGARRLAAVRALGWRRVKVWVSSAVSGELAALLAEQHENTLRKPFTPTEAATLYEELKRLHTEDAARRQHATRFGACTATGPGGAESAPPEAGKARALAARAVTGKASHSSLEHVGYVRRLAADPAAPAELRETARRALAAMDTGGTVDGHYLAVRAAELTDALQQLASDPAQPASARGQARTELAALLSARPSSQRVTAAQRALTELSAPAPGGRALAAVRHYPLRAFLAMADELTRWWEHYDPAAVAAGLTEAQWQAFRATVAGTVNFTETIAAARRASAGASDPAGSAAGF